MQVMRVMALTLGFLAAVEASSRVKVDVTPVQKVIQLMEGMLAKGKQEKHAEQTQYAAYAQWCEDTSAAKGAAIEKAALEIEVLKADVQKYTADAAALAKEIAGHDQDIAVWEADIKAATKVREMDKDDYDKMHLDYSESIDALERAIVVLKKQAYDRKQAGEFVQLKNLQNLDLIPAKAKKTIDLFLAQGLDAAVLSAPEANAYEFQSGGIVSMLEKLLDEFTDKRTELMKKEMNSKHAFEMLIADLTTGIAQSKEDRMTASKNKAMNLQSKADAEGDLTDTIAVKTEDEKYKSDLDATCTQKATDFESRQSLRAEELEAIEKAIDIIKTSAVSGAAQKYLPTMLQQKQAHDGFAQVRALSSAEAEAQARVAKYLQKQAQQLNSRVLATLAAKATEDPFAKVKKMIKDLIVRLMDEANEEAEHKGWCDTELATNEKTRNEKTAAVESLNAEIGELTASISLLGEEISELSAAVAQLDTAMAEATKLREEEKEKNSVTVKDAQEAQLAVSQALSVLKEFYSKAAGATALVQQPEIFDSPYKGMQAENGGVIGMLEVIESDFARLEAETKAAEASATKEYDTFMTDSKVDKKAKTTDIAHKSAKKSEQESALVLRKSDLEGTQAELDAALAYFDKLKPSCVDEAVSYNDRVGRREEEIKSLQEALKILNGEGIAL